MRPLLLAIASILCFFCSYAQVAIGTTTPSAGSAFEIESHKGALVPPRMTDTEMRNIPEPLPGAVVYNLTDDALFVNTDTGWIDLSISPNAAIVFNRSFDKFGPNGDNNLIKTGDNSTYYTLPINTANVLSQKASVYEVTGQGSVKLKKSGNFLFTVGLSIIDIPAVETKFILALFINDKLVAYPSRGFVNQSIVDYWGTSGTVVFPANAGDTVTFKYIMNNGSVTPMDARFINAGIMQL